MAVDDKLTPEADCYLRIAVSFFQGLVRIWSAEAASARLMLALVQFHGSEKPGMDSPAAPVLEHLDKIPYSSYDALSYVTDVSHLVYATTLLDTFLSDTTTYLFLLFPGAMGKNQQIPLKTLIDASSRNEALTKAAAARAREISYLPFIARIDFLKESFGLSFDLDKETTDALVHYSTIRNTAVHDQGIFELSLDETGRIQAKQKACSRHPTKLGRDDVSLATKAYERVARAVAKAIFTQTLKKEVSHPAIVGFLEKSNLTGTDKTLNNSQERTE